MSVEEIRDIALGRVPMHYKQASDGFVVLDDLVVRNALLAYAAMVERCEKLLGYTFYLEDGHTNIDHIIKQQINYILKGVKDDK